jgi:hypothetical protein
MIDAFAPISAEHHHFGPNSVPGCSTSLLDFFVEIIACVETSGREQYLPDSVFRRSDLLLLESIASRYKKYRFTITTLDCLWLGNYAKIDVTGVIVLREVLDLFRE